MEDEKKLKNARNVYKTVCDALDGINWKYEKLEDDLVVRFNVTGEDLPMQMIVRVNAEKELVSLISFLPFSMAEDKRPEGAIATGHINYKLADGSFDYDYASGKIYFRMTSSFKDSILSKELFSYMINVSCSTVDEYNDKLFMLSKGMMSLDEFLKI